MRTKTKNDDREKQDSRRHQTIAEDERGWAGQHGQRPANDEEKNYPPPERRRRPDANLGK